MAPSREYYQSMLQQWEEKLKRAENQAQRRSAGMMVKHYRRLMNQTPKTKPHGP